MRTMFITASLVLAGQIATAYPHMPELEQPFPTLQIALDEIKSLRGVSVQAPVVDQDQTVQTVLLPIGN